MSVIIPAHDEEAVIGRCLDTLLADAEPGELEIVVVCNGCHDATARVSHSYAERGVNTVEVAQPAKTTALNAGDAVTTAFPRFYLDADMQVSVQLLRRLAAGLAETNALAASARPVLHAGSSTWPVRSYHRVWTQLPSVRCGLVGAGLIGLTRVGRSRFGQFPEVIADDYFLDRLFRPGERFVLPTAGSVLLAPRRTRDLLRRKVRVFAGNRQLHAAHLAATPAESRSGWLTAVRRDVRLLPDVPAYLAVTVAAKALAWRRVRSGRLGQWARDDSSREVPTREATPTSYDDGAPG